MTIKPTTTLASLPSIGATLLEGTFAGVTTCKDGTHCAVVLLPTHATKLTWAKADAWAKKQSAELPSCPVAALLFANLKDKLKAAWHWTSDEYASCAWLCFFDDGYQGTHRKSAEGSAVAVRLIPLTA